MGRSYLRGLYLNKFYPGLPEMVTQDFFRFVAHSTNRLFSDTMIIAKEEWTVNQPEIAMKMKAIGVDFITTDILE